MQTFLPYPDFAMSAACLDNKRLGKQRVEAKQIYLALTNPTYGWQNHPAVKMWKGYSIALTFYGECVCAEWIKRGFKDSLRDWFYNEGLVEGMNELPMPLWVGNSDFHASHRSNLLRKDPVWYGKFGWTEPNNLPYVWPVEWNCHLL